MPSRTWFEMRKVKSHRPPCGGAQTTLSPRMVIAAESVVVGAASLYTPGVSRVLRVISIPARGAVCAGRIAANDMHGNSI